MTTQFDNIYHGLGKVLGRIRFSAAGLGWKPSEDGVTVTIPSDKMASFQWVRAARHFQLTVELKGEDAAENGQRTIFQNFQRHDQEQLAQILREYYDKPLDVVEVSTRGWNWGSAEIDDQDMKFLVRNKLAFALPLANIANSNIAGRTEVSMEFLNPNEQQPEQNTGASSSAGALPFSGPKKNRSDQLVEMRLYIPGQVERDDSDDGTLAVGEAEEDAEERGTHDSKEVKEEEQGVDAEDTSEADEEEGLEEEESAALAFHNAIKARADIGEVAGDGILVLKEVLVLTPRGRYDIDLFPQFLRLRGKTYDYKILYSSITQLFLLPKLDDIHVLFVVALQPPIRQGQTRYPYLVLQFPRDEEMDAELNLDEETIQTKYDGKLKKRYEEPTFRIVTNLFRVLSHQKVSVPSGYTNSMGQECVRCNIKANDGTLYPLNKSMFWVSKQPLLIPYADIHQLIFSRVGGAVASAKTFDIRAMTRSGVDHTFQSINREELDGLNNFFAERKIRIKNELMDEATGISAEKLLDDDDVKDGDDDEEEDEDEDFEDEDEDDNGSPSEGSSDDDDDDAASYSDEGAPKSKKLKSGPTSSGKSTLVQNLLAILHPPPAPTASPIAAVHVLHQDDFAPRKDQIPWNKQWQVADWDTPHGSTDYRALERVIRFTQKHHCLPPDFQSSEDRRTKYTCSLPDDRVTAWRERFHASTQHPLVVCRRGQRAGKVVVLIVEGFLTLYDARVRDLLGVRVFLRVSRETMLYRRTHRPNYVLEDGEVWEDPPFYFDEIVWPAFREAHAGMFVDGDVERGAPVRTPCATPRDGGPVPDVVLVEAEHCPAAVVTDKVCEAVMRFADV
ncbi:FACT complex subunit [Malassezia sp. CBS 17886]|nr:FACT complex subunit [Malassezia sp. CBS 17886]